MSVPREAPIQVTVMLDQAEVAMEIDTGAFIPVMSEGTFRKTWKEAALILNCLMSV